MWSAILSADILVTSEPVTVLAAMPPVTQRNVVLVVLRVCDDHMYTRRIVLPITLPKGFGGKMWL